MDRLDHVIRRLWPRLVAGEKFNIPGGQVEHPEDRPDIFSQPPTAWPVGQLCDHVWRQEDGSRVHAQCITLRGESIIQVHRDKYDPDHSFRNFVLHGLTETPIGPILGVLAAAWALGSLGKSGGGT